MSFLRSLFSLSYYRDAFTKGTGIRLLIALLVITLLNTIVPSYKAITLASAALQNLPKTFQDAVEILYPEDLEVDIANGKLRINKPEPYTIAVNTQKVAVLFGEKKGKMPVTPPTPVIIIDTKATVEDFSSYNIPVLITQKSIVFKSENSIRVTPLSDIMSLTVSKQIVSQKLTQVLELPLVRNAHLYLVPLLLLCIFLMTFLYQIVAGILFMLLPIAIIANLYGYRSSFSRFIHGVGVLYFSVSLLFDPIAYIPMIQLYIPWSIHEAVMLGLAYLALIPQLPQNSFFAALISPAHLMVDALKNNRAWYKKLMYSLGIFLFIWITWWNVGKEIQQIITALWTPLRNNNLPSAV